MNIQLHQRFAVSYQYPVVFTEDAFAPHNDSLLHAVSYREPSKRHRLLSHNSKYIRTNRGTKVMSDPDAKIIKGWMPYG